MKKFEYCPFCAVELKPAVIENRERLKCGKCGWVDYKNPLPAVAVFVTDSANRLLLVKRAFAPYKGAWSIPGGFVEMGETIEQAALRELAEETGLSGTAGDFVGAHIDHNDVYGSVMIVGVEVFADKFDLTAGDDASGADFFATGDIPEIPILSHRILIQKYLSYKK
ncbi:MAG TPA: NUDIX hydrolase [Candidatus Omnitrophota bacterium]|nr:NUDIX hydrolase [Candidatus Omnitrophota bacterium]HPS20447.1 NUDIX hydrolase [Candidatus Omnitrophota bacterium]